MIQRLPIIKSLRRHFDVRAVEWGMAGWAFTWGLMVLAYPSVFTQSSTGQMFSGIKDTVSWTGVHEPTLIGVLFVVLGIVRAISLFINGAWRSSPLVRIIAAAVSAFFIMHIVIGFAQGPPNTGTVTYTWLFLADCLSAKRATEDWLQSRKATALIMIKE